MGTAVECAKEIAQVLEKYKIRVSNLENVLNMTREIILSNTFVRAGDQLFVRIPAENISFEDPYEQSKFSGLLNNTPQAAIDQIEEILENQTTTISLE